MRRFFLFFIVFYVGVCRLAQGQVASPENQPNPSTTYAFVGVNVVPMDRERILKDYTVVVHDGVIERMGPRSHVRVSGNYKIIRAPGKFLMPGLADMHFHLNDASGQLLDQILISLIASGVTTVRDMNGFPSHLRIREEIREGRRLGPTIFAAGPITDSRRLRPYFRVVSTPEEARQAVVKDKRDGYDFFKVYSLLSADAYAAIIDTARKEGIPVVGHVPESVGLPGALRARQKSIEHLYSYFEAARPVGAAEASDFRGLFHAIEIDESRLPALARATREAGVWNTPTLLYAKTRLPFEGARRAWEQPELRALGERNRKLMVLALRNAGAGLLLGTDASASWHLVPGFSIHDELELLVEAGLSPYEAIRAGTTSAARFVGQPDKFGAIAKGMRGDFILLTSNPLRDINSVRSRLGVMVAGNWYPIERLTTMLAELGLSPDGRRREK